MFNEFGSNILKYNITLLKLSFVDIYNYLCIDDDDQLNDEKQNFDFSLNQALVNFNLIDTYLNDQAKNELNTSELEVK